jgi:hypothetical protein
MLIINMIDTVLGKKKELLYNPLLIITSPGHAANEFVS